MKIESAVRLTAALTFAASLAGCGALFRNPVPSELTASAKMPDMPDVRAWAARTSAAMERDLAQSFDQESPEDFPRGADGVVRYPHLALSGGGANGAFGAGFLYGWSSTGRRPVFKIVTGVSTGALMAPFAFLGPSYDGALREFYTTTTTRDIFALGSLLVQLVRGDALADTGPLAALIARHVDAEFLRDIAAVHARGRRLYIGTADLDSQRFVVWNMGLIATAGGPEALDLFRKVMLASASIPVVFPPVFFEVEAGGQRYDEMHVDGAVGAHVFLNGGVFRPALIRERAGRGGAGREDIFVIHNGQLRAESSPTPRSVRGIATRVIEASGRSAVVGDLFRIYAFALSTQAGFQWVTIAEGVDLTGTEFFDPVQMGKLYEVGYRAARAGPEWELRPPGFQTGQPPP
jgi:predicted acylesterase/phospholipase RssA